MDNSVDFDRMNERELLIELNKKQARSNRLRIFSLVVSVLILSVLAYCALTLIPKISSAVDSATVMIAQTSTLIESAGNSLQSVDQVLTHVNSIDYESLSNAIASFSKAAETVSRLFSFGN